MQNNTSVNSSTDLRPLIDLLFKWLWLILLLFILGGSLGFLISKRMTPIYRASSTVLVNKTLATQIGDYSTVLASQQLAVTYSEMLTSRPILEGVIANLRLPQTVYELQKQILVAPVKDTQLIRVDVEDSDPEQAAKIANELITVFTKQIQDTSSQSTSSAEANLQSQLSHLEQQITNLQSEMSQQSKQDLTQRLDAINTAIDNLEKEITQNDQEFIKLQFSFPSIRTIDSAGRAVTVTATPSVDQRIEISGRQAHLDELKSLLNQYQNQYVNLVTSGNNPSNQGLSFDQIQPLLNLYQNIYSSLMQTYETLQLSSSQNTMTVTQIERAAVPVKPAKPSKVLYTLLGGVLGLCLATGGVFFIEAMDDRIKDPKVITRRFNLRILGAINRHTGDELIAISKPRSPETESYRLLRTNLLHTTGSGKPPCKILITSPTPSDGKTTIAANLAVVMEQAGIHVVLIDADLYRPHLHELFKVADQPGLTDLLMQPGMDVTSSLMTIHDHGLTLLPSGALPENPSELLGSKQMINILDQLSSSFDVVIIDTPPTLSVTDALLLVPNVDGVILVVKPGATNLAILDETIEQLKQVDANLLGIVLNLVDGQRSRYYKNVYSYGGDQNQQGRKFLKIQLPSRSPIKFSLLGLWKNRSGQSVKTKDTSLLHHLTSVQGRRVEEREMQQPIPDVPAVAQDIATVEEHSSAAQGKPEEEQLILAQKP